jgi:hypothetical protein
MPEVFLYGSNGVIYIGKVIEKDGTPLPLKLCGVVGGQQAYLDRRRKHYHQIYLTILLVGFSFFPPFGRR